MSKRYNALVYASVIGLIIVAIFLGFLSSLTNPISWLLILALALFPFIYKKTHKIYQFKWSTDYEVGIAALDKDHRKLLNLLNQFNTAYNYAMSEEYERQSLTDLLDYTRYHFEREEKLMQENDFPGFEEHKQQHQTMIDKIKDIEQQYEQQGHEAFYDVSHFLSNWLINHIRGTDKQYSKYLLERGVQ